MASWHLPFAAPHEDIVWNLICFNTRTEITYSISIPIPSLLRLTISGGIKPANWNDYCSHGWYGYKHGYGYLNLGIIKFQCCCRRWRCCCCFWSSWRWLHHISPYRMWAEKHVRNSILLQMDNATAGCMSTPCSVCLSNWCMFDELCNWSGRWKYYLKVNNF